MVRKLFIGLCLCFSVSAFAELVCTSEEKGCSLRILEGSAILNCAGISEIQFTSFSDEGTRLHGEISNDKGPIQFTVYEPTGGPLLDSPLVSQGHLSLFGGAPFLVICSGKISDRVKPTSISRTFAPEIDQLRSHLGKASDQNRLVLELFDEMVSAWLSYSIQSKGSLKMEQLLNAIRFASEKHRGQYREGPLHTPYIIHPMGVAKLLWNAEIRSVDILTAALLHDTLEDTSAQPKDILNLFGSRVLSMVQELTDQSIDSNGKELSSQASRDLQVAHAAEMSQESQQIKLADRIYNLKDIRNLECEENQPMIKSYRESSEKLLLALRGAHQELEQTLEMEIRK